MGYRGFPAVALHFDLGCQNSRLHLIFTVNSSTKRKRICVEKSAWMLILGLAATEDAFEADLQIDDASRYELW